jgi:sterile alpha motif and leucine zipper containing kinase AZK
MSNFCRLALISFSIIFSTRIAAMEPQPTTSLQTIPYSSLKIGDLLGHGGYGDVYKAIWHGSEVAIKQLHLKTLPTHLKEEFEHEAQVMAQCQYPNIINLYGIVTETGHHALVMEYMPKGSLRGVLNDKSQELSWETRWLIAIDIAKGLSYLHSKNILHRDLKSLNILLGNDYHAKICDFGLAKIKLESSSTSTKKQHRHS